MMEVQNELDVYLCPKQVKKDILAAALPSDDSAGKIPTTFNFSALRFANEDDKLKRISDVIYYTFPVLGNYFGWNAEQYSAIIRTNTKLGEYTIDMFVEPAVNSAYAHVTGASDKKNIYKAEIINYFKNKRYVSSKPAMLYSIVQELGLDYGLAKSYIMQMTQDGFLTKGGRPSDPKLFITELMKAMYRTSDFAELCDLEGDCSIKSYWAREVALQVIEDAGESGPLVYSVIRTKAEWPARYNTGSKKPDPVVQEEIKRIKKEMFENIPVVKEEIKEEPVKEEEDESMDNEIEDEDINIYQTINPLELPAEEAKSIFTEDQISSLVGPLSMMQLKAAKAGQPGKSRAISSIIQFLIEA